MALNNVNIRDRAIEGSPEFRAAEAALAKLFMSARSDIGMEKTGNGRKVDRVGSGDELTGVASHFVGRVKRLFTGRENKEAERGIETFRYMRAKFATFFNRRSGSAEEARAEELSRFYNIRGNLILLFRAAATTNRAEQARLRTHFTTELTRLMNENGTFTPAYQDATRMYLNDVFDTVIAGGNVATMEAEMRTIEGTNTRVAESTRTNALNESLFRGALRQGGNTASVWLGAAALSAICPPAGMSMVGWLASGMVVGNASVGAITYTTKNAAINKDLERTRENPVAGIETLHALVINGMRGLTGFTLSKAWARAHINYNYILANIGTYRLAPASMRMLRQISLAMNTSPIYPTPRPADGILPEADIDRYLDRMAGTDVNLQADLFADDRVIHTNLVEMAQRQEMTVLEETERASKRRNLIGSMLAGSAAGVAIAGTAINMTINSRIVDENVLSRGTDIGLNLGRKSVSSPSNNWWQGQMERFVPTQHSGIGEVASSQPFYHGPELKMYESVQTAVTDEIKKSVISDSGYLNFMRDFWANSAGHNFAGGFSKELIAQGVYDQGGELRLQLGNHLITNINALTNSQSQALHVVLNSQNATQVLQNAITDGNNFGVAMNYALQTLGIGSGWIWHSSAGAGRRIDSVHIEPLTVAVPTPPVPPIKPTRRKKKKPNIKKSKSTKTPSNGPVPPSGGTTRTPAATPLSHSARSTSAATVPPHTPPPLGGATPISGTPTIDRTLYPVSYAFDKYNLDTITLFDKDLLKKFITASEKHIELMNECLSKIRLFEDYKNTNLKRQFKFHFDNLKEAQRNVKESKKLLKDYIRELFNEHNKNISATNNSNTSDEEFSVIKELVSDTKEYIDKHVKNKHYNSKNIDKYIEDLEVYSAVFEDNITKKNSNNKDNSNDNTTSSETNEKSNADSENSLKFYNQEHLATTNKIIAESNDIEKTYTELDTAIKELKKLEDEGTTGLDLWNGTYSKKIEDRGKIIIENRDKLLSHIADLQKLFEEVDKKMDEKHNKANETLTKINSTNTKLYIDNIKKPEDKKAHIAMLQNQKIKAENILEDMKNLKNVRVQTKEYLNQMISPLALEEIDSLIYSFTSNNNEPAPVRQKSILNQDDIDRITAKTSGKPDNRVLFE